jgi:hypothetical protein
MRYMLTCYATRYMLAMLHAATPHDPFRHTIHANMLYATCRCCHYMPYATSPHDARYMPHAATCHIAITRQTSAMMPCRTLLRARHMLAMIHATRTLPHGTLATQPSHIAITLAMLATCHTPHAGDAGRCHIATLPLHAAGDDPCQTCATFRHMPLRHMPLRSMPCWPAGHEHIAG